MEGRGSPDPLAPPQIGEPMNGPFEEALQEVRRRGRLRLRRYRLSPADEEDLLQELHLRVWSEWPRWPAAPDGPWCDTILYRLVVDLARERRRQERLAAQVAARTTYVPPTVWRYPEGEILRLLQRGHVWNQLSIPGPDPLRAPTDSCALTRARMDQAFGRLLDEAMYGRADPFARGVVELSLRGVRHRPLVLPVAILTMPKTPAHIARARQTWYALAWLARGHVDHPLLYSWRPGKEMMAWVPRTERAWRKERLRIIGRLARLAAAPLRQTVLARAYSTPPAWRSCPLWGQSFGLLDDLESEVNRDE